MIHRTRYVIGIFPLPIYRLNAEIAITPLYTLFMCKRIILYQTGTRHLRIRIIHPSNKLRIALLSIVLRISSGTCRCGQGGYRNVT